MLEADDEEDTLELFAWLAPPGLHPWPDAANDGAQHDFGTSQGCFGRESAGGLEMVGAFSAEWAAQTGIIGPHAKRTANEAAQFPWRNWGYTTSPSVESSFP